MSVSTHLFIVQLIVIRQRFLDTDKDHKSSKGSDELLHTLVWLFSERCLLWIWSWNKTQSNSAWCPHELDDRQADDSRLILSQPYSSGWLHCVGFPFDSMLQSRFHSEWSHLSFARRRQSVQHRSARLAWGPLWQSLEHWSFSSRLMASLSSSFGHYSVVLDIDSTIHCRFLLDIARRSRQTPTERVSMRNHRCCYLSEFRFVYFFAIGSEMPNGCKRSMEHRKQMNNAIDTPVLRVVTAFL